MSVKLLTELHLKYLSLKGGCTGSSESTHVKMPHCWKSHVTAHIERTILTLLQVTLWEIPLVLKGLNLKCCCYFMKTLFLNTIYDLVMFAPSSFFALNVHGEALSKRLSFVCFIIMCIIVFVVVFYLPFVLVYSTCILLAFNEKGIMRCPTATLSFFLLSIILTLNYI